MYGILQCTSKSRINGNGIPFIQYGSHTLYTIHSKKHNETHTDQWVKVHENTLELMEVIGPVGSYDIELAVLRHLYRIGCKYPSYPILPRIETKPMYQAVTVDGPTTLDRDDALSIHYTTDEIVIGIHITDVTKRLSPSWLAWAQTRGSSVYWETGTKPMLPVSLAHSELSLTNGQVYPCISVLLHYSITDHHFITHTIDTNATVLITDNLTYEQFNGDESFSLIAGTTDSTEIVAWCMVQYNKVIASHYAHLLVRVQEHVDKPATYSYEGTHASFDHQLYCHATSPIRRFADMYNQFVIQGLITDRIPDGDLTMLNKRMTDIQHFHYRETVMNLSYRCKASPMIVYAQVTCDENGRSVMIRSSKLTKSIRISLHDIYDTEEIWTQLQEQQIHVLELFGIHKHGSATLRIRRVIESNHDDS